MILIALGLLFLVGQLDWFSGRLFQFTWPVLLIGLGVWLIVRRLQGHARQFARRAKMSRYILIRRLRWPAILLLIGVLALLHQAGVIAHFWRLFWPLLLIMLGVLLLAERAALAAEGDAPYFGAPWQNRRTRRRASTAAGQTEPAGTAIVPSQPHDFENDLNGGQS